MATVDRQWDFDTLYSEFYNYMARSPISGKTLLEELDVPVSSTEADFSTNAKLSVFCTTKVRAILEKIHRPTVKYILDTTFPELQWIGDRPTINRKRSQVTPKKSDSCLEKKVEEVVGQAVFNVEELYAIDDCESKELFSSDIEKVTPSQEQMKEETMFQMDDI